MKCPSDFEIECMDREFSKKDKLLGITDYAIFNFFVSTGCRPSEVANASLDCNDDNFFDLQTGTYKILKSSKRGFPGKLSIVIDNFMPIKKYINEGRLLFKNSDKSSRLFLTKTGSEYTPNKMSKKISMMLTRIGFPEYTGLSLRHYFCTNLLKTGMSLLEAQELMRHQDMRSCLSYIHFNEDKGYGHEFRGNFN